jgi:hypothetical protein
MISSCATDRIQYSQIEEIDCKTPETRYHQGKNLPIHAIKSNNRKYTRNVNLTAWNRKHHSYSANNLKKEKHSEKLVYDSGEGKRSRILIYPGIEEVISLQQIPKNSEISLYFSDMKHIPDLMQLSDEKNDFIKSTLQEDYKIPAYSYALLNQDEYDIFLTELILVAPELIQYPLKSNQSQEAPSPKNGTFILLMALLGGLITLAAIKATPNLGKNISFWAAMNPWKTRIMFTGVNIGLGIGGVFLGEKLAGNGVHFSDLSGDLLLAVFLTSALLYPVRYSSIKLLKHSFFKQKVFDMALALSGFILMINAGNTNPGLTASFTNMINLKSNEQQNVNMSNAPNKVQKQLVFYQDEKQLQDEQAIPQKKGMSLALKILLTVLTVMAGLGLGYLLVFAACGLACNGMEALAYLVGIGGGILLILLAVLAIKSIWHPKHRVRIKSPKAPETMPQESPLQI